MSSTNRGAVRVESDAYLTPSWAVVRILDELVSVLPPKGCWLEPCAGEGAIIKQVKKYFPKSRWSAVEIREECRPLLAPYVSEPVRIEDFLTASIVPNPKFDVILTNPPYSQAGEFLHRCLPLARHVVFLLRLAFLASAKRAVFMHKNPPDVYVLPNRPKFLEIGDGDSAEYAWFYWGPGRGTQSWGRVKVLELTSLEERKLG
jgi:hypothetical protein